MNTAANTAANTAVDMAVDMAVDTVVDTVANTVNTAVVRTMNTTTSLPLTVLRRALCQGGPGGGWAGGGIAVAVRGAWVTSFDRADS